MEFINRQGLVECLVCWCILYILLLRLINSDCLSDTLGFFDNSNYDRDRARRRRRDDLDREAAFQRARDAARQHTRQPATAVYTHVRRPANAIAGPSNQHGNGVPGECELSPTQMETELLTRLANGSGLSQYDCLGFLETCTRCGNVFLSSFLGRHLTSCINDDV